MVRLAHEAIAEGFDQIKLKVGGNLDDDIRRLALARREVGPDIKIAIDANQRWDVADAIAWVRELQPYDLAWIEEPTSPDDLVGHAAIRKGLNGVPVATGEHTANRVMFKQLLQLEAIDVMQIDAARVAGVNENLANLLLAAKFGVRVCPHAGGVGLCEAVQHLSMIDFVAVSGSWDNRYLEFVDHLHEHFVDPVRVVGGRYLAPQTAGAGTEMPADSLDEYRYNGGLIMTRAQTPAPPDLASFIDDRLGLFIHFGLYALAGRHEWVQNHERIHPDAYAKYFEHFDPDLFDAADWARQCRRAGMRYAVLTTKHHEGFCLWDTAYSDYKITNTPFGRDLVRRVRRRLPGRGDQDRLLPLAARLAPSRLRRRRLPPAARRARSRAAERRTGHGPLPGRTCTTGAGAADVVREISYLFYDFSYPAHQHPEILTTRAPTTGARPS